MLHSLEAKLVGCGLKNPCAYATMLPASAARTTQGAAFCCTKRAALGEAVSILRT